MSDQSQQDVPLATVVGPAGLSEVVLLITAVSGLLVAIFGQDWGVRAHAQDIASAAFVVAPAVLGLIRAWKHHSVTQANAAVQVEPRPVLTDNGSYPDDGLQDVSQDPSLPYVEQDPSADDSL